MKKIFYILLFIFGISLAMTCCRTSGGEEPVVGSRTNLHTEQISTKAMYEETYTCKRQSFDSICYAENIPNQLSHWNYYDAREFETKDIIRRYVYIKSNDTVGIIANITYILSLNTKNQDTTFNLSIRKLVLPEAAK